VNKAYLIYLAIIFSVCFNLLVYAENIPDMKECTFIVLRTSEGWWLRINNDESGSYGFGVQPERVEVKKDTFDFRRVYTETKKTFTETRKNAEGQYIAVSYYASGNSSAREYYLSQSRQWLAPLFIAARNNSLPPANELEERSHDKIEAFWKKSPFLSPNKPDTVDGK
jgi:hypothetical protein